MCHRVFSSFRRWRCVKSTKSSLQSSLRSYAAIRQSNKRVGSIQILNTKVYLDMPRNGKFNESLPLDTCKPKFRTCILETNSCRTKTLQHDKFFLEKMICIKILYEQFLRDPLPADSYERLAFFQQLVEWIKRIFGGSGKPRPPPPPYGPHPGGYWDSMFPYTDPFRRHDYDRERLHEREREHLRESENETKPEEKVENQTDDQQKTDAGNQGKDSPPSEPPSSGGDAGGGDR